MAPRIVSLLLFAFLTGCRSGGVEEGPLLATRDTVGEMVLVRVASGSQWEKAVPLREDLRLGSLEEEGIESFGSIGEVAVGSGGTIIVLDQQLPALLRFSEDGRFLGKIGRQGSGPGEYGRQPNGLMVDGGGRIVLSDPENARVSAYSGEGEYLGLLGSVGGLQSAFGRMVAGDEAGRIYVRVLTVELGRPIPTPWPIGLEVRQPDGLVIDTIPPPTIDGEAAQVFGVHPDGSLVVADAERSVLEIRSPVGEVVRIEMPFQPVPYTETELTRLGIALRPAAIADGRDEATLPEMKPAYIDVFFDPLGRIWLRRPVEPPPRGESTVVPRFQPSVLDAFERDGTYLGVVNLPPKTRPVAITEAHLYLVQMGEYDEEYVVRYQLEL